MCRLNRVSNANRDFDFTLQCCNDYSFDYFHWIIFGQWKFGFIELVRFVFFLSGLFEHWKQNKNFSCSTTTHFTHFRLFFFHCDKHKLNIGFPMIVQIEWILAHGLYRMFFSPFDMLQEWNKTNRKFFWKHKQNSKRIT